MNVLNKIKSKLKPTEPTSQNVIDEHKNLINIQKGNNNNILNIEKQIKDVVIKNNQKTEGSGKISNKIVNKLLSKVQKSITQVNKRQSDKSQSKLKQSERDLSQNQISKSNILNLKQNKNTFQQITSKQPKTFKQNIENKQKSKQNKKKNLKFDYTNEFQNNKHSKNNWSSKQQQQTSSNIKFSQTLLSQFDDLLKPPNTIQNINKATKNFISNSISNTNSNYNYKQNYKYNQNNISKQKSNDSNTNSFNINNYSQNSIPIPIDKMPKQYSYVLIITKMFIIGKMSIFEGYLENKIQNKQLNIKIRKRDTKTVKISCKVQTIENPQSIAHIFLKRILQIGDNQYLISQNDIIKCIQKSNNKK